LKKNELTYRCRKSLDEKELLRKRRDWQKRYDKRRVLVLILEIVANLFWIAFGILSANELEFQIWLLYYISFAILFFPGIGFVVCDYYKTKKMKLIERIPNMDAEKEDLEFTKTIIKSSQFLTCFLILIIIPAFILLDLVGAFQWSFFFIAIFTLAIATLAGACWRMNTSWKDGSE
jgi:hypothetical protein